ncbi:MAG: hypothetical protein GPJ54_22300 [Candidatus Heimdallarchaeota archaeon]|nr:hypothetical protein [Candidatus Heimdallarchaeota archaeon]
MSDDTLKIQFDMNKIASLKSNIPNIEALEYQFNIFDHMGAYLDKYLDLEVDDIILFIILSAKNWQTAHSAPMSHFIVSLPQERLVMAEQFKKEAFKVFGDNLANSNDYENLEAVLEHAFVYYLKEFATR